MNKIKEYKLIHNKLIANVPFVFPINDNKRVREKKKQGRIHGQKVVTGGWAGSVMRVGRCSTGHGGGLYVDAKAMVLRNHYFGRFCVIQIFALRTYKAS